METRPGPMFGKASRIFTIAAILAILSILSIVAGALMIDRGKSYPVYRDPDAPGRLSIELADKPRDERFQLFYDRLPKFETPHKRLTDQGRGWVAAGVGTLLALGVIMIYHRPRKSRGWLFILCWCGVWAIRLPFASRYYRIRQQRFDYPTWGDSVAIPLLGEIVASIIGCAILGAILSGLMISYDLPDSIRFRKPSGFASWTRQIFLAVWVVLFLQSIVYGISDGDEGTVISGLATLPLLLAVMWAKAAAVETDPNTPDYLNINQQQDILRKIDERSDA